MEFTDEEVNCICDLLPDLALDVGMSDFLLFLSMNFEIEKMVRLRGIANKIEMTDDEVLGLYEVCVDYIEGINVSLLEKVFKEIEFRGIDYA